MMQNTYNTEQIVKQQTTTRPLPLEVVSIIHPATEYDFNVSNVTINDAIINIGDFTERLITTANQYRSYSCAANQVGVNARIFVAGYADNFVGFFNPVILDDFDSEEILEKEVDSISFPGLILNVRRFKKILLQYQDFNGEIHKSIFEGLTARVIQQSIDTLNGIPFTHRVSKIQLERANKALNKKIKQVVRAEMSKVKIDK